MGAAISATAGFLPQFYAGVDRMFGYSVYNIDWVQGQLGINLVFGSGPKRVKKVKPQKEEGKEILPYKGTMYFYPVVDNDTTADIYINNELVADMFGFILSILLVIQLMLRSRKRGLSRC